MLPEDNEEVVEEEPVKKVPLKIEHLEDLNKLKINLTL